MTTTETVTGLLDRMVRAARLDATIYEEVEADRGATGQAAFVVVATSIAAAIGGAARAEDPSGGILAGIGAIIGWAVYAWLAVVIGSSRFLRGRETKADWGEVARTLGFASTPRFALLLGVIPGAAQPVGVAVGLWVFVATIVALRASLELSTWRAIATALLATVAQVLVPYVLILVALGMLEGVIQ